MNVIEELRKRGFIDAITSEDLVKKVESPISFYIGFDPTSDSLHIGNLVGIMALCWFQKFGHNGIGLLGGATARIGDPSGKSVERPLLSEDALATNVTALEKQLRSILEKGSLQKPPKFLNNDSWFKGYSFIEFLRDIGRHFRMGSMLAKDSVKTRLHSDEGISFTEFSYQVLQGYDFCHLNESMEVELQLGGSDQWGNITAGIEITRKLRSKSVYGMTFPLLVRSDGKKFGKTEGGAVWLSKEKTSPYQFYQYLIRIPDSDVIKMMRMLTFMEMDEILEYEEKLNNNLLKPNEAQGRLATEVTLFVHGEKELAKAISVTKALSPGSDATLDGEILEAVRNDMPNISLSKDELLGSNLTEVFVKTKLLQSKGEANRLIKNGGAYLNNSKVVDGNYSLSANDLIDQKFVLLGSGKKKKLLVIVC